jgi:hypothetical protein
LRVFKMKTKNVNCLRLAKLTEILQKRSPKWRNATIAPSGFMNCASSRGESLKRTEVIVLIATFLISTNKKKMSLRWSQIETFTKPQSLKINLYLK